jgi:hypothetical protein
MSVHCDPPFSSPRTVGKRKTPDNDEGDDKNEEQYAQMPHQGFHVGMRRGRGYAQAHRLCCAPFVSCRTCLSSVLARNPR